MRKLKSLFVSCVLVAALSGVVLADGGIAQGPGLAAPAPPDGTSSTAPSTNAQDYAAALDLTVLMVWLEQSIL